MINLNSSIYIQEISNFFIIFLIVLKFLFEWLEKKKKKKKKIFNTYFNNKETVITIFEIKIKDKNCKFAIISNFYKFK